MHIADNIIKYHLRNVYFITGGACGGKTTVTRYLSEKHDMLTYNWDEHFPEYQALADPVYQPALSQRPALAMDWEEYFMRPVEQYSEWLSATFKEGTDMVVADLIRLSGMTDKKIIVDGFFSVEHLKVISDHSRMFFLLSTEEVLRHDYFNREDKQDMLSCIMELKNPQAALENVFQTMLYKVDERDQLIRESGFKYYVRDTRGNDPMILNRIVEEHFFG